VFRKYRKLLIYFLVFLVPFFLLFVRSDFLAPAKSKLIETSSVPVRILLFPFREIRKLLFYHRTYDEYQELKREVAFLRSRLVEQEEVLRENSRFKELLALKKSLVFSSVVANVIGRDPSNWNSAIIIDKGRQDGLETGMPVIDVGGVIGKVAEAGETTSKVILLTDPNFSVPALVQRTREQGLVSGTLQGICRMRYLPADSQLKVGDKVLTSKLSSSFPEGLLIGEVIRVDISQSTPTAECLVRPSVSISQLEEVLVLRK
jgi:rod shape-determining protein MreC